ncbi:tyrosine-type recombinase/integrase [Pseudoalteromonas sp. SWN166]|uniref:tyrosine-type recombinase/integrase n=1 Tax=Pseudoalteromonas sp. SWN166 TaxID=2792061 RepID=UPI0018CFD4D3|nr:tyrosine-type recombinase/integrase [Pseudoalteromonas sp. SWN166]MBH0037764.1 site-specific integrase [Pseudoalteromonas sp. SWN166]
MDNKNIANVRVVAHTMDIHYIIKSATLNFKKSTSYIVQWTSCAEFPEREFPLVYLCNGTLSYSLLCYINHLYKTKRGKNTTKLYDLFRVVGDLTQYCLHRSDMISKWEKHPQQMLLCFFEDLYCGTVNNTCLYGLSWDGVSLTTIRKLINEFDQYAAYVSNYLDYNILNIRDLFSGMSAQGNKFFKNNTYSLLEHLDLGSKTNSWNNSGVTYEHDPKMVFHNSNSKYSFFPPDKLESLLDRTNDINQRALYLLCAFTGLRASEALNIMVTDIVASETSIICSDIILSPPHSKTYCPTSNKLIDRKQVLLNFKLDDTSHISLDKSTLKYLNDPKPRTNAVGKYHLGWKGISVPYGANSKYGYTLDWVNDYARMAFERLIPHLLEQSRLGHPYLFCLNTNGTPLTYNTYYRRLSRASTELCGESYGTHCLRHFCGFYIANTLKKGIDFAKVILRHKRHSSTAIYYNLQDETSRNYLSQNLAFKQAKNTNWQSQDFKCLANLSKIN